MILMLLLMVGKCFSRSDNSLRDIFKPILRQSNATLIIDNDTRIKTSNTKPKWPFYYINPDGFKNHLEELPTRKKNKIEGPVDFAHFSSPSPFT